MTKNWELFAEDPRTSTIPNQGVTKVESLDDDAAVATLRYELKTFVCDGAYREGLLKILHAYLEGVGAVQTAAWVSGFYGSGKSHLVKVLEHLWRNEALPDGSTPRGLVRDPGDVAELLIELDTVGRRNGGRLAAAGSLLNGPKDVNTAFASILLGAAGLPTHVPAARCVLWMHQELLYDGVLEFIVDKGIEWEFALENLYASDIAEGILATKPGWAASPEMAREQLWRQFPESESVALPDLLKLIEAVLEYVSDTPGKLPATLVVLDEMQAFIADDLTRANEIQGLVEACQSRFGGLLYIVATGQSDLGATAALQKLIDRFNARQQLSDTDVDKVIRQVVLDKRQDRVPALKSVLDANAGEIDRQLGGAVIAPTAADGADLVPDYPILPSRRRFWEKALQAVDRGGRAGQLRTQLKVVHEALRQVADADVGTVVAADFLYSQQESGMLTSGVLLREVRELINAEASNGSHGPLRSRILALVFLISQLSREGFSDTGVRSTPDHIADLLVDDLESSGQDLRKRVPVLLEDLRADSKLSLVDGEYILQSKTGQEWNQDYRARVAAYAADLARIAMDRDTLIREELQRLIPSTELQGAGKVSRRISIHFGNYPPSIGEDVPVWVRTGWDTSEQEFQASAAATATASPIVFVYVPKQDDDELTAALASTAAASETISQRPNPTTNEGVEAKKAVQSQGSVAEANRRRLAANLAAGAVVALAGGKAVAGTGLGERVRSAIGKSLARLYPRFAEADAANWHIVMNQATAGKPNALEAIGYHGEATEHPVCKEVLVSITAQGTSGADLRNKLTASLYGWSTEAVQAATTVLVVLGALNARLNGTEVAASAIKTQSFGKTVFRKETTTLSMDDRLRARGVLTDMGIGFTNNEEAAACGFVAQSLDALLREAGGEPPLPSPPVSGFVAELKNLSGATLVKYIADHHVELKQAASEARALAALKPPRLKNFATAEALARQLPDERAELSTQLDAVRVNRTLLTSPDPVALIVAEMAGALRACIGERHATYSASLQSAVADLESDIAWMQLTADRRSGILSAQKLDMTEAPNLGTNDQVRGALEQRSIAAWDDLIAAIPGRISKAREEALALTQPQAKRVSLPKATISTTEELEAYILTVTSTLSDALAEHSSIVI